MERSEVVSKSSIADILEQSSCAICSGMETHRSVSAEHIIQFSGYSSVAEAFGKQKKPMLGHEHQFERTATRTKEKQDENNVQSQDKREKKGRNCLEYCFLSSSISYGGPDDIYGITNRVKNGENEIKAGVRKLEEATDPFQLEYTTRGNWWKGSLHY